VRAVTSEGTSNGSTLAVLGLVDQSAHYLSLMDEVHGRVKRVGDAIFRQYAVAARRWTECVVFEVRDPHARDGFNRIRFPALGFGVDRAKAPYIGL
jgi:hypothetical protein